MRPAPAAPVPVGVRPPWLVPVVCLLLARGGEAQVPECREERWEQPRTILSDGRVLRSPQVVDTREGTLVVGVNRVGPRRSEPESTDLVVTDWSGRPWGPPAGAFDFEAPVAVGDGQGGMLLYWGDSGPGRPLRESGARVVSTVRSSAWVSGGWSPPEIVLSAQAIDWSGNATRSFAGGEPHPHALVGAVRDAAGGASELLLLQRPDPDGWIAKAVPAPVPDYVAALVRGSVLTVAATGWTSEGGRGSLRVAVSRDEGTTWSAFAGVASDTGGPAQEVWLFPGTSPEEVTLLWASRRDAAGGTVLRILKGAGGGGGWGEPVATSVQGGVNRIRAVADRCGHVHVVAEVSDRAGRPSLSHLVFSEGAWSSEPVPSGGDLALEPGLAADLEGGVPLVWTEAAQDTAERKGYLELKGSRLGG